MGKWLIVTDWHTPVSSDDNFITANSDDKTKGVAPKGFKFPLYQRLITVMSYDCRGVS